MEQKPTSPESPQFSSPEEEVDYLRERLNEKEGLLEGPANDTEREKLAGEAVQEYESTPVEETLAPEYQMPPADVEAVTLNLTPEKHDDRMEDLLGVMEEKGLRNALSVVAEMNNPHITDDFHRFLIQYIAWSGDTKKTRPARDMQKALHMKLYEISLPPRGGEESGRQTFKEMVSAMEQFYAGMLSIADSRDPLPGRNYFTIEIALAEHTSEVVLYASVPASKGDLFEKQVLAVFPEAHIAEHPDDYNIFNEDGASVGATARSRRNPIFPLRTYDTFDHDPLNVVLNVFSKMKEEGEGAAVQIVIAPAGDTFLKKYGFALDSIRKGVPAGEAISAATSTFGGLKQTFGEVFLGKGAKPQEERAGQNIDETKVENIKKKIESTIVETNMRIVASAESTARAEEILSDLESAFHQFENAQGNGLRFAYAQKKKLLGLFKEFSYRLFNSHVSIPLNLRELTTLVHFPVEGTQSPQLKESKAGNTAPAPTSLPKEGLKMGSNIYRGKETPVYMRPEDRLRHFYTIGQTGTGKTNLLKNMIVQDIHAGEGVCMIDPHSNGIDDVLANVPKERAEDVIYFDPAHTERPMGLNMLEYDVSKPDQKTFVVDELFSIFQKLYAAVPESMGPAFEQYFRNATMLVTEDPETGNTLLDVSRVLSDAEYRKLKLSRCNNPVVVQFWEEIAEKAGGDTFSLQNVVPYITNKFDVFTANDIMRPIIAQEKSAFDFRDIMDNRKILLVNLSKGRLGERNANLIGLILVGKILQAALSRVDIMSTEKPAPFYLYIDEFHNITTPSIATILSEVRKYGLSLNIAHQFIDQLEENIKDAVFGNVGSLAAFRAGTDDAEFLEHQFGPVFTARDISTINNFNAYVKLLVDGVPTKPFSLKADQAPEGNPEIARKLKELSFMTYGRDRAEIEAEIAARYRREQ